MPYTTVAGRHRSGLASYMEEWARRYPEAQFKIERHRLRTGRAKHRVQTALIKAKSKSKRVWA